jgi:FkbM family methyltransferase
MIDVGANFGYFSALWLRGPDARLIAVEPHPTYVPILRRNLAPYGDRARVFACAIGETEGDATFAGEGMLGHVVPDDTPGGFRVPMTTLDWLLGGEPVELLKIDAEGYDLKILDANRDLFSRRRVRLLLWERADTPEEQAFVEFLRGCGYRPVLESSMFGFERT